MIRRASFVLFALWSITIAPSSVAAVAPEWSIGLNDQGVRALREDQWEKAIDKLSTAVLVNPHDALARKNLATAHNNYGISLFTLDPVKAFRQFHYAVYFDKSGEPPSNLIDMTHRMGRNPGNFEDHLQMGDKFKAAGDLMSAAVEYRAAMKLRSSKALDQKIRAVERLICKQHISKLENINDSKLEESDFNLQDYEKIISLLILHGNSKYATKLAEKCVHSWPADGTASLQLSTCYIRAKNFEAAESTLLQAQTQFADSATTRQEIAKTIIECDTQGGYLEKLEAAWKSYLADFPNSPDAKLVQEKLNFYKKDFADTRQSESKENQPRGKINTSTLLKIYIQKMSPQPKDPIYTKATLERYDKLAVKAIEEWEFATRPRLSLVLVDTQKQADVILTWTTDLSKRKHSFSAGETESFRNTSAGKIMHRSIIFLDHKERVSENDFYETCLHELGHAMNLEHSSHPEDIMYWSANAQGSENHVKHLSRNDIDRIKRLYGEQ